MLLKGPLNLLAFITAAIVFFALAGYVDAAGIRIYTTSFNASRLQTDHDECTGASGRNLCTAAREGDRTIALSRDLLWRWGGPFRWHDKVRLVSDVPQCNGLVLSVEDTMHRRWSRRADLFFLDRSHNTSCQATIEKVAFK